MYTHYLLTKENNIPVAVIYLAKGRNEIYDALLNAITDEEGIEDENDIRIRDLNVLDFETRFVNKEFTVVILESKFKVKYKLTGIYEY